MTVSPYPLPRETRESTLLVGDGTVGPYGPSTYKVWDTADVIVMARADGEEAFTDVTADCTIAKTAAALYDTFSVTFDSAVPATTDWYHQCRRTHERQVAATHAGAVSGAELEKELAKIASVVSELRRDIDRSLRVDLEFSGSLQLPVLGDAQTFMWDADNSKFIPGPTMSEIEGAQGYAEAAAAAKNGAETAEDGAEDARDIAVAAAATALARQRRVATRAAMALLGPTAEPTVYNYEADFSGTYIFDWSDLSGSVDGVNYVAPGSGNVEDLATDGTEGAWVLQLADVARTGSYNDLGDKPSLAAVATSGSFNDLSDVPPGIGVAESATWNACCDIWQRGTSFPGISTGTYTMDRMINGPGGSGTANVTREEWALDDTSVPRLGSPFYHRMAWTGAPSSGEGRTGYPNYFSSHESRHEDIRRFAGLQITVSGYIRVASGSVPNYLYASMGMGSGGSHGKSGNTISGTGAGTDYNHLATEVFQRSAEKTITTSWVRQWETFTLDDLSAATIGATGNVLTIGWGFDYGYGPTVDTFGLKYDVGPEPLPLTRRDLAEMMMLAKRNHYRISQISGISRNSSTIEVAFDHPTAMANTGPSISLASATPNMSFGGAGAFTTPTGSGSAWATSTANQRGMRGDIDGFSGLTAGYPAQSRTDPIIILSVE